MENVSFLENKNMLFPNICAKTLNGKSVHGQLYVFQPWNGRPKRYYVISCADLNEKGDLEVLSIKEIDPKSIKTSFKLDRQAVDLPLTNIV